MRIGLSGLLLILPALSFSMEPYTCRNGAFSSYAGITPAEITAGAKDRVYLHDDTPGCPDQPSCARKSYLINADKVLVAHPEGGWACAYFFKSDTAGWVPQKNVKVLGFSAIPGTQNWLGNWVEAGGTDTLVIRQPPTGNLLELVGKARWLGGKNSDGEQIVHFGSASGAARPSGTRMTIKDDSCVLELELIGPYLIANDSGICGGINVRFNGVYQRRQAPPP
jgi:hypothetical protein